MGLLPDGKTREAKLLLLMAKTREAKLQKLFPKQGDLQRVKRLKRNNLPKGERPRSKLQFM